MPSFTRHFSVTRWHSINNANFFRFLSSITSVQLLKACLIIIIASGVLFRVNGFDNHVTYIDELIVLTEGKWNAVGKEATYHEPSTWNYVKKLTLSDGITYAPLQFFVTHLLIQPYEQFSYEALIASRIPSVALGCLCLIIMCLLFYSVSGKQLSFAMLLPLSLLAASRINIVNSQQNHTYIFGVFAILLILISALWLMTSSRKRDWLVVCIVLSLLTFSNYLIPPIIVISILGCWAVLFLKAFQTRDWKSSYLKSMVLLLPLSIAIWFSVWVLENKSSQSIAWWVKKYTFAKNEGIGIWQQFVVFAQNIMDVFMSVLDFGGGETVNRITLFILMALVLFSLLVAGFSFIFKTVFNRGVNYTPALIALGVFLFFIALYFLNKMPLSPTRHTLVFAPVVLTLMFYCTYYIEVRLKFNKPWLNAYRVFMVITSGFVLGVTFIKYPQFMHDKTEAYQVDKIIEYSKREHINTIATNRWSYNKLFVLMKPELEKNHLELVSVKEEKDFPKEPFLLVGQHTKAFYKAYDPRWHKQHTSKVLYENIHDFDFEPSPDVEYWPNKMRIYRVDPI